MEISGSVLKAMPISNSPKQKSDPSAEIQKLEQQKKDIQQQIKSLEQSKHGGDAIKTAKDKLQKQIKEIEKQIQVLKQQGTAEMQSAEDDVKAHPPQFDEYVKNDKKAFSVGIYSLEQDENGNPLIVFDSPEKPVSLKSPEPIKPQSEDEKLEIMKCTVSTDKVDAEIKKLTEQQQSIQQQLRQAENPEKKAKLEKQLSNIEAELRTKDNDAYKKQNATYTYSKES